MIDLKKYSELKEKNAVSLVKAGDSYAMATKKFDPETGVDLPDEVVGVNMIELTDRKKELQDKIVEVDAFMADCKAIK